MTLLQARWSYTALATDELSFKEGDCITLVKKWNDDWWEGVLEPYTGLFPRNRVIELETPTTEIEHNIPEPVTENPFENIIEPEVMADLTAGIEPPTNIDQNNEQEQPLEDVFNPEGIPPLTVTSHEPELSDTDLPMPVMLPGSIDDLSGEKVTHMAHSEPPSIEHDDILHIPQSPNGTHTVAGADISRPTPQKSNIRSDISAPISRPTSRENKKKESTKNEVRTTPDNSKLVKKPDRTEDDSKKNIRTRLKGFFMSRPSMDKLKEKGIIPKVLIFGGDITQQCERWECDIPPFVTECIKYVENFGLENVGLYRLSGNAASVNKFKQLSNESESIIDPTSDESFSDINVVTGAFKLYLRDLSNPLMTFDMYESFIAASRTEGYDNKLMSLKHLIQQLPTYHYNTLKYLITHLHRTSTFSAQNKMEPSNLAIVFGPTIMRPKIETIDAVMNTGYQNSIVEQFIVQADWFFDEEIVQIEGDGDSSIPKTEI